MILPNQFRFSQASLQDFQDCRRRFQLRYIDRLAWPAIESEPALELEEQMRLGALFHRMVQQHQSGIPAELVQASIRHPFLLGWWQSYLDHQIPGLPDHRRPEYVLSVPLGRYRLIAKMDLVAYEPGKRVVIVDWKTGQQTPSRRRLADRLQTKVYRYVAVEAGAHLNGGEPFSAEQVSLVYWFANDPARPEIFEYSAAEHETVGAELLDRAETIAGLNPEQFFLADDERACRFCLYRSLCRRGTTAGSLADHELQDVDPDLGLDLDIEQIGEIAF